MRHWARGSRARVREGGRSSGERPERTGRRALLRYAAGWVLAGALIVGLALATIGDGGDEDITLPPVLEVELATAARNAGCQLAPAGRGAPGLVVSGPRSAPAAPATYREPPPVPALVGALRRGNIVVHHDPELPGDEIERLDTLRRAVPRGTIVTANPAMPYTIAVTAWRRLLGCPRTGARTIDAVRLFRGRFIGRGPDAP